MSFTVTFQYMYIHTHPPTFFSPSLSDPYPLFLSSSLIVPLLFPSHLYLFLAVLGTDWTQGFANARQALYQLHCIPAIFLVSTYERKNVILVLSLNYFA